MSSAESGGNGQIVELDAATLPVPRNSVDETRVTASLAVMGCSSHREEQHAAYEMIPRLIESRTQPAAPARAINPKVPRA